MDNAALWQVYDALPDLLNLARSQKVDAADPAFDVYACQDQLAQKHESRLAPYIWSMPYRHLVTCPICGWASTEIQRRVVKPQKASKIQKMEIMESELHAIRQHGAPIPARLVEILKSII